MQEIKEQMESLANDWNAFQRTNDEAIKAGKEDSAAVKERLAKIEESMAKKEDLIERMDKVEAAVKRTGVSGEDHEGTPKEDREAFQAYLRSGIKTHAMSSYADPEGGYTVIPEMDKEITRVLNETSPMRQFATVKTIGTDEYQRLQRVGRPTARWSDRESVPDETSTTEFQKIRIKIHKLEALPRIPMDLINDSTIDIEGEVRDSLVEEFSLMENQAFVTGDGTNQPKGILDYDAGTGQGQVERINSGDALLVTDNGLVALVDALKDAYRQNGRFYMNRRTRGLVKRLRDGDGNYLWQPNFQQGEPMTLLGYPVSTFEDLPDVAANSNPIIFGDMKKAYKVIDRQGLRFMVDPYTSKGYFVYYTSKRVGGGVDNFEAVKILSIAA